MVLSVTEDSPKRYETSYFRRIEIIINKIQIICTFLVKRMTSSFFSSYNRIICTVSSLDLQKLQRVNTEKEIGESLVWNTYPSSFRTEVQKHLFESTFSHQPQWKILTPTIQHFHHSITLLLRQMRKASSPTSFWSVLAKIKLKYLDAL